MLNFVVSLTCTVMVMRIINTGRLNMQTSLSVNQR
jgi:hypothetical protein